MLLDHEEAAGLEPVSERGEIGEEELSLLVGSAPGGPSEEDHRGSLSRLAGHEQAEVGICGDQDALFLSRPLENLLVGAVCRP